MQFKDLNLDQRLLKALKRLNWEKPTLIQEKAIPLALNGKDIIARAKTGSGKTGAFAIPLIQQIVTGKREAKSQCTMAIVIVPTKELAAQVCLQINNLLQFFKGEVTCVDMNQVSNIISNKLELRNQPDILVSTPTALLQQLKSENISLRKSLQFVVLDEADLLFSYGFETDVKEILKYLPDVYQAFLTSATLNTKTGILKSLFLHNPAILKLEESQLPPSSQLTQYVIECSEEEKFVVTCTLFKLALIKGKCIVFLKSIDRCYRLKMFLANFSVQSVILNGELPANSRCHIVDQFNRGLYNILIACDEAVLKNPDQKVPRQPVLKYSEASVSRGIDFADVSTVINFDFPASVEEYVHRVGRTARAWNQGTSISFVTERDMKIMKRVKRALSKQLGGDDFLKPYRINISELDSFRYRSLDALRSITTYAVRETRLKEIKIEMLKSEELKTYFAKNPNDHALIRHDKTIEAKKCFQHLKHVPDYIVPQSMRGVRVISNATAQGKRRRVDKSLSYNQRKTLKRKADPLNFVK